MWWAMRVIEMLVKHNNTRQTTDNSYCNHIGLISLCVLFCRPLIVCSMFTASSTASQQSNYLINELNFSTSLHPFWFGIWLINLWLSDKTVHIISLFLCALFAWIILCGETTIAGIYSYRREFWKCVHRKGLWEMTLWHFIDFVSDFRIFIYSENHWSCRQQSFSGAAAYNASNA